LYHRVCVNEEAGIKLYQEMAEQLTRYELVGRMMALMNDLSNYTLRQADSRLWREYYSVRLAILMGEQRSLAEKMYRELAQKAREPKLRAYVLCDLGGLLLDRNLSPQMREEGKRLLEQSLSEMPVLDSKTALVYAHLSLYYYQKGQWNEGKIMYQKRMQFFEDIGDEYGIIHSLRDLAGLYAWMGDWRISLNLYEQVHKRLAFLGGSESLKANVRLTPWAFIWSGRLKQTEYGLREAIELDNSIGFMEPVLGAKRDLAFVLGLQDCFDNANTIFSEVAALLEQSGRIGDAGALFGFWGYTKTKEGDLETAKTLLIKSWQAKQRSEDTIGYQEVLNWLGMVSELIPLLGEKIGATAETYYLQSLSYRRFGRHHFECGAVTGLVRVKHAQGDYDAIPPLLAEAEQLAQQYEYNDHLASLRLTQAHIASDGQLPEWGSGSDAALHYYQLALIHALRYNRFLLDEVLSGRPQGTPLLSIIPRFQGSGEEGQRMLISLCEWWQRSVNDIGASRPDAISPIQEGIPLLEAEHIARNREPGDGSIQLTVVEQIDAALQSAET
jgi:tetratricopeptide (TPR) repeat protein